MNQDQIGATATAHTVALQEFTHAFFTRFGATVSHPSKGATDAVTVTLSSELAAHFGRTRLNLCFHHSDIGRGELVAFGSRIYDQMLAFLHQRSALTVLTLPRRFAGGEELLAALRPVNAGITGLKVRETQTRWVAFDWQITFRADDKREELFTVLLDENGTLLDRYAHGAHVHSGHVHSGHVHSGHADGRSDSAPAVNSHADDEDALTHQSLVHDLFVQGQPSAATNGDDGRPDASLPPMTQLGRLAETARKYAIYHADLRCIEHEADILPRLHKTLSRLTNYYNQQIEEVYDTHDPDGEKRRALEADLERKVAEEVENHRLRVQVNLLSYAVFHLPVARASISLGDGRVSADVTVERNLFTGALHRPHCHACGGETTAVALDRNGHLTCDACIRQCDICQEIYCAACGVAPCPVCERNTCESCGRTCLACGERACAEHADRCPTCGDLVCHACQSTCAACGVRQCRSHLRRDTVLAAAASGAAGDETLICPRCAVRCPGCNQYSAQLGVCEQSGQRFCRNCLHTCRDCGRVVGPGFYETEPSTEGAICHACATTCPTCGAFASAAVACHTCGAGGCEHCMAACEACSAPLCPDHARSQGACAHIICDQHDVVCAIGGEFACPVCRTTCSVCDRPYCDEHSGHCSRCRQEFCSECVRRSGLCDVCARIDEEGEFVALVDEPCAADPRVQLIMSNYRWLRLAGTHLIHYLGRDRSMQAALIVVQRQPAHAQTAVDAKDQHPADTVHRVRRVAKLGMLDTPHRDRWL